jgi:hypothetical protein
MLNTISDQHFGLIRGSFCLPKLRQADKPTFGLDTFPSSLGLQNLELSFSRQRDSCLKISRPYGKRKVVKPNL